MRIIAQRNIGSFIRVHPETEPALSRWTKIAKAAKWSSTAEVQSSFKGAKVINGERVRFEVAGGNYRMIVAFQFEFQVAFIKFIGSHAEYDRVDAVTVSQ